MSVQIQLRRGSSTQWATVNPILAEGEFAVETDTKLYKIGDGVAHWNDLPYGGPGGSGGSKIEMIQVSPSQFAAKQLALSSSAILVAQTLLWIDGVSIQKYGIDYTVAGNILNWSGLGMETIIESGDYIIIQYKI